LGVKQRLELIQRLGILQVSNVGGHGAVPIVIGLRGFLESLL
jgi:hypothetical protein